MILCGNPKAQYLAHKKEIDEAIQRALDGGRYILGNEVEQFEKEFAQYLGVHASIGCGNGTDALVLAIRALDIGPGDEVITVAHTAVATVAAIELTGATAVLADIDPKTYTIDPKMVEKLLTERTKAIIPVHIYGQAADLDSLLALAKKRNIPVIEDCAQAHGAKWKGKRLGSFTNLSCFSFYPTKNLGALGDGGAVATSDPELAKKLKLLREYGWAERYISSIAGANSRLDEIQAAALRVKLRALDNDNARRRQIAKEYERGLKDLPIALPFIHSDCESAFHLYVIRTDRRDELQEYLKEKEILALVHYPMPVHLQPAYKGRVRDSGMEQTEKAAREVLSLPMYPELAGGEIETVIEATRSFFSK